MPKLRLRPEVCAFLVAGFVLVCLNAHFWRQLYQTVAPSGAFEWLFLASVLVVSLVIFNLLFGAFAIPYVFKPAITLLLLVAATASYFMDEYGTAIDAGLLRNIIETNAAEVRDLLTVKLAGYLLLAGALPIYLLWHVHLDYGSLGRALLTRTLVAAGIACHCRCRDSTVHQQLYVRVSRATATPLFPVPDQFPARDLQVRRKKDLQHPS
jgi:lipid A ethanolaminephosphotransferase